MVVRRVRFGSAAEFYMMDMCRANGRSLEPCALSIERAEQPLRGGVGWMGSRANGRGF